MSPDEQGCLMCKVSQDTCWRTAIWLYLVSVDVLTCSVHGKVCRQSERALRVTSSCSVEFHLVLVQH